jgi:hypothetical protein
MPKVKTTLPSSEALHIALETALDHAAKPHRLLAAIIASKIRKARRRVTRADFAQLEKNCEAYVATGDPARLNDGVLRSGKPLDIELRAGDGTRMLKVLGKAIEVATDNATRTIAKRWLRAMIRNNREAWSDHVDAEASMRRAVHRLWGYPIRLLATQLRISRDCAMFITPALDRGAQPSFRLKALTMLQARACQVAEEILVLMEGGFADGAFARWRTLHELAVLAMFIAQSDEDTAHRYLDHGTVEACHASKSYQKYARRLGERRLSKRQLAAMDERMAELQKQYGPEYVRGTHGWAAKALGMAAPKFNDIEAATKVDHLRPYYKWANDNVHGGAKGNALRLGLEMEEGYLLLSRSSVGLFEPGRACAVSLCQVTVALLTLDTNVDRIVYARVIIGLSHEVERQFALAYGRLQKKAPAARVGDGIQ